MAKNAVQFPELLKSIGSTKFDMERDSARAWIMEGREQLVKITARKEIGKTLTV